MSSATRSIAATSWARTASSLGAEMCIRDSNGTVEVALGSGAKPVSVAFTVPAPLYAGLELLDPIGNPIVNAIVRAFALPAQTSPPTPAIELGEAITDATGQYDLYVALPE